MNFLTLRYRIDYSQSEPVTSINYFSINATSGAIYVHRSLELDTLRTSVYKLKVIAEDQGMEITTYTLQIISALGTR